MFISIATRIKYLFGKRNIKDYCTAFQNNAYFRMDGSVTPCSANCENVFGRYPEMSVKEIFEGKQRTELIKQFNRGEIPSGCYNCSKNLKNNNYKSASFQNYNKRYKKKLFPVTVEFELSNHCNLKCIMCNSTYSDQHSNISEASNNIIYDDEFVNQLIPYMSNFRSSSFKGGEPFLISIYYQIWDKLILMNRKNRISVTSNGTILNKNIKDVLSKGKFHINISIDSLNQQNFENIRKNATFKVFKNNLDYFIRYSKQKKTSFNTCVCIMSNNYLDIIDIFKYANANDFNVYLNFVEVPKELSLRYLTKEELQKIVQYFENSKPSFKFLKGFTNSQVYNSMINQLKIWMNEDKESEVQLDKPLSSVDAVYQQLVLAKETIVLKKINDIVLHFESTNNSSKMIEALGYYSVEKLYSILHELNTEELISFIDNAIFKFSIKEMKNKEN
jgi:MoaA/NifB/PqqE/SkfB family radical SAM enzyme